MITFNNAVSHITKYADLIAYTKSLRNFNAHDVYNKKLEAINNFFKTENLNSAVVGLSGGIDSTLVLKLLLDASMQNDSPIEKVVGLFMPIYNKGITGQDTAKMYVNHLNIQAKKFACYEYKEIDLSSIADKYAYSIGLNTSWGFGQVGSIVRTPALYGYASKLQEKNYRSIVVGTTNRDEGAYIGFFGKASDGMVDLQPIADLHKSEVRAIAKICGIDDVIINRPPMGDVWDGKLDEEMFGATYEMLEMYQILLENDKLELINNITDKPELITGCINIVVNHKKNIHKYKVGSPARYIDILKRNVI